MKLTLLIALFAFSASGQIAGNPANWCRGGFFTREAESFQIGTVKPAKAYFYGDDRDTCPGDANCRLKSYVVKRDQVVISKIFGGFACAWFTPKKGYETVSWMRLDDLTLSKPPERPPLRAWIGEWIYGDNSISFSDNKLAGFLNVTGNAMWRGLGDNVHVGELDGRYAPEGSQINYSDGDDMYDCKASLHLVGPYLVVDDNQHCGGANVTFSGIYRKKSGVPADPLVKPR